MYNYSYRPNHGDNHLLSVRGMGKGGQGGKNMQQFDSSSGSQKKISSQQNSKDLKSTSKRKGERSANDRTQRPAAGAGKNPYSMSWDKSATNSPSVNRLAPSNFPNAEFQQESIKSGSSMADGSWSSAGGKAEPRGEGGQHVESQPSHSRSSLGMAGMENIAGEADRLAAMGLSKEELLAEAGIKQKQQKPKKGNAGQQEERAEAMSARSHRGSSNRDPEEEEEEVSQTPTGRHSLVARQDSSASSHPKSFGTLQDSDELVIIHVCDETKGINRDFACERSKLLSEMKYFEAYLGGNGTYDEIDISVHCDVQVFEWLIQYINLPNNPPPLDVGSAISILISSDFLLMEKLVQHCVEFVSNHLNEILKLPLDLSCLNDTLILAIARKSLPQTLAEVKDKKDKLLSKLYKKRLEIDFRERGRTSHHSNRPPPVHIHCCKHCLTLFPSTGRNIMTCPSAPLSIGFRGQLVSQHCPREEWSLTAFVGALHASGAGWPEIYWLLWGLTRTLWCSVCGDFFAITTINNCRYHPEPVDIRDSAFEGQYSCCEKSVLRFSGGLQPLGCKNRRHIPDDRADELTLTLLELQGYHATGSGLPEGGLQSAIRVGAGLPPEGQETPAGTRSNSEVGEEASTVTNEQRLRTRGGARTAPANPRGIKDKASGTRPSSGSATRTKLRRQNSKAAKSTTKDSDSSKTTKELVRKETKEQEPVESGPSAVYRAFPPPPQANGSRSPPPPVKKMFDVSEHPLTRGMEPPAYLSKLSKEYRLDHRKMRAFELDHLREDDVDRMRALSQSLKGQRRSWVPNTATKDKESKDSTRATRGKVDPRGRKGAK